ncbi:MAG TPA: PhzF family phenazine biosynthesis protein [Puia sp.]|nr:PhzF family phenazine biosynthesis protein [Puia sp.]
MSNTTVQYYVVDVFTREKYKGNPLAVVCLDLGLEPAIYQKIAKEFGYSETSFVYYSSGQKALKVRSFTPAGIEVNGAGHNLLGAVCLALEKEWDIFSQQKEERFVMMKDEVMPLSVSYLSDKTPFVGMLQRPATLVNTIPVEEVAPAIGLSPESLLLKGWAPTVVSTEVTHLMVPVKDKASLHHAMGQKTLLNKLSQEYDFEGCYCFTLTDSDPVYIAESRFFNPGIGIEEDPATGSAAGPLAGFLHSKRYIQQNVNYSVLQGVKMGQPSTLQFSVTDEGIWVKGSSVIVMEGTLYL